MKCQFIKHFVVKLIAFAINWKVFLDKNELASNLRDEKYIFSLYLFPIEMLKKFHIYTKQIINNNYELSWERENAKQKQHEVFGFEAYTKSNEKENEFPEVSRETNRGGRAS